MEMESFLQELGKQLKTMRKQMGLSQVSAAQNMHIDYRHYQNIEGGKINLRLDTLIKLVKFYSLDKATRPFNVDACIDLLTGIQGPSPKDNWDQLVQYFVEGGHAGYFAVNGQSRLIESINPKLFQALGYRSAQDLTNKPLTHILIPDSANHFNELIQQHAVDFVSKPFMVTFRTQPPANPIPMMAVVHAKRALGDPTEHLYGIFFDRKTLDEEGHRLKDILNGYQQFMELYPQLRAV